MFCYYIFADIIPTLLFLMILSVKYSSTDPLLTISYDGQNDEKPNLGISLSGINF